MPHHGPLDDTVAQPIIDFLYDPDDWNYTYDWEDRSLAVDDADLVIGKVKRFATMIRGPDRYAALVVLSRDDRGDPNETEIQWFDNEAAATAAAAHEPATTK